jgi:acetyl esterase/lipase
MANNTGSNSNPFGDDAQSLLTEKAFALAMSPPRSPPAGTAHRDLLLAKDPSRRGSNSQHQQQKRLHQLMHKFHQSSLYRLPHPHLSAGPELGDQITRFLGVVLPVHWHNACRDSGSFRFILDSIVTATAPIMGITSPSVAYRFLQLTANSQRIRYGSHPMQYIDLYLPNNQQQQQQSATNEPTRLIFFVHGGAWGSGLPWFYRLTALPFLQQGWAVAVIGYRTYPDSSTVDDQVADCSLAASCLADKFPELCERVTFMGHSSGAHVAMLIIVDRAKRSMMQAQEQLAGASAIRGTSSASMPKLSSKDPMTVDSFVGLSGPYDISHHFDYEAARGVEELSPMKAVCGYTRQAFRRNSPVLRLEDSLVAINECQIRSLDNYLPKMVLVHGIEDDTVPFTATGEAARVLRTCGVTKCQEYYVPAAGHQETVMQLMLGGRTREAVVDWIKDLSTNHSSTIHPPLLVTSKL